MSYPLTRKIYAVYTDPSASMARGFLAHLTSERGQKIIFRMGLKPEIDFQRLVNIKQNL
jgi:ABC-type Fe3+ transport system substrate-binding protein